MKLRDRQCGAKVKHGSEIEALRHARLLALSSGEKANAYRCQFCGNWHAGREKKKTVVQWGKKKAGKKRKE
jgi:hypothetical protein